MPQCLSVVCFCGGLRAFFCLESKARFLCEQVCYGRDAGMRPAGVCFGDFGGPLVAKDNWTRGMSTSQFCKTKNQSKESRTKDYDKTPCLREIFIIFHSILLRD